MRNILAILTVFIFNSCIEEMDTLVLDQSGLPNILIVEATVTDELKYQEVRLSRLDSLLDLELDTVFNPFIPVRNIDADLVNWEQNARVSISVSNGNTISFSESSPGTYRSNQIFAAEDGLEYQLNISTNDGKDFSSKSMKVEGKSTISNIYAERMLSDTGEPGVGIFVDTERVEGNANNLRFTYDETYKIIAPNWAPLKFQLTDYDPCALPVTYNLELVEQTEETRICFGTESSDEVIQNELELTNDGNLTKFMVNFISQQDYKISHRYSIEVNELVSSAESYGFYNQLKNFSQSNSLFSQVQPGSLGGNITESNGSQDGVIGFFDVVSVSKSRMFFNYEDFFPGEPLPEYPVDCGLHSSPESHVSFCAIGMTPNLCPQSIIERVDLGTITYVGVNGSNLGTCPGPYLYVASPCGDCTRLGSNVIPDFWEE